MNESDDYNFSITDNSNLSSLFGNENSFDIGNSSLLYKAPKEPGYAESKDTKSISTKFFYKYIILHEIIADNEREIGKYILGLMSSEGNLSQILVYQNKKNMLLRFSIDAGFFSKCEENSSLTLMIEERKWLLKFMTEVDYTEFVSEFSKQGGRITDNSGSNHQKKQFLAQKKNFKLNLNSLESSTSIFDSTEKQKKYSKLNLNSLESNSSILDTTEKLNDSLNDVSTSNESKDSVSKREKEEILTRLAKIGLPLLPSLHREIENITSINDTFTEEGRKNITKDENINSGISSFKASNQYSTENNQQIMNIQKGIAPITIKDKIYNSQENNFIGQTTNQIQTLNSNTQIDPISLIIAENRISNNELKQYLSLISCKLDSITNLKELDQHGVQTQLKSKIRALEMKSENLEDELSRCQNKYGKLEKINAELASKLETIEKLENKTTCTNKKTISSQTDYIDNTTDVENVSFKYQLITLLKFLQCLPLKSEEFDLTQLKSMKDDIVDEEVLCNFNTCIHSLQEKLFSETNKPDSIDELRNSFIRATKKVMFDMYLTVSSNFSEQSDIKNLLAEQVRSVTTELVRNFDKSIQCKK